LQLLDLSLIIGLGINLLTSLLY